MKVRRVSSSEGQDQGQFSFELLDDCGKPLPEVLGFMSYLSAHGCSPNTLSAYAHDLLHFARFLVQHGLDFQNFTPVQSILFLEYLRSVPSLRSTHRYSLVLCVTGTPATTAVTTVPPMRPPPSLLALLPGIGELVEVQEADNQASQENQGKRAPDYRRPQSTAPSQPYPLSTST